MHPQIQSVIDSLHFTPSTVCVTLTAGESTPLGNIVGRIYYHTDVLEVLDRNQRFGYPNNGGQHTLSFRCSPKDAVTLIELIKETVVGRFTYTEQEARVANELSFISQEILAGAHKCRNNA